MVYDASYVFYGDWCLSQRLGRSDAASIIDLVYNFAPGPVQEVKKVEVIEQAVSLVLAEELIHFPTVYSCIWYQLCFICSSRSRDTVPQSISLELAVKTTCHSHFGQHGLSRFMRSRDHVSYHSLFNLWILGECWKNCMGRALANL